MIDFGCSSELLAKFILVLEIFVLYGFLFAVNRPIPDDDDKKAILQAIPIYTQ